MIEVILDKSITNDLMEFNSTGKKLQVILLNQKNIFVISKSLLEYIEENIKQENLIKWTDLFQSLHDEGKFKNINGQDTLNVYDIYNSYNNTRNYILILKNDLTPLNENYVCCLKDTSSINQIFTNILINNEITFRYVDFNTNDEIFKLINKILTCSKTNERLILISRYSNFDCKIIEMIKDNFAQKTYWTTYKSYKCSSNDIDYLKQKLGTKLMIYTGKNSDIHERQILIDSMLIDFDDDFDKIDVANKTWKCTFMIDSNITNQLRKKQSELIRFH